MVYLLLTMRKPSVSEHFLYKQILGPISKLSWCRGDLVMHHAADVFFLPSSKDKRLIFYGGREFNEALVMTTKDLVDMNFMFCEAAVSIHDVSIFSKLLN
jgi:hypothetical protein